MNLENLQRSPLSSISHPARLVPNVMMIHSHCDVGILLRLDPSMTSGSRNTRDFQFSTVPTVREIRKKFISDTQTCIVHLIRTVSLYSIKEIVRECTHG